MNRLPTQLSQIRPAIPQPTLRSARKKECAPGGYGLLLAAGTVDELIYSEIGNEVLLIKHMDSGLGSQYGIMVQVLGP